jgi:regulator of cell morphogenesis and NO signaling
MTEDDVSGFDRNTTVGGIVAAAPAAFRTFERLGIDYCCGGKRTLDEACGEKGLDPEAVLEELAREGGGPGRGERDWREAPLSALADHIVGVHHAFLRENLPRLDALSAKVLEAHGERHPELEEVRRVFLGLQEEIALHMHKEEMVLFPMVRELETASFRPSFHCGSLRNPIGVMEAEHDSAGRALARLRELTGGYVAPADGCVTYGRLLEGLAELEEDLHRHIHEENSILFPRAAEAEAALPAGCGAAD